MSDQPDSNEAHPIADVVARIMEARRFVQSRTVRMDADYSQLTDEKCQHVVEEVKEYQKEKRIKQAQIAKALLLSTSVISQVLAGNYKGDSKAVVLSMARWLDRRREADASPEIYKVVDTEVARRIRLVAQQTIAAADAGMDSRIGLVWGEPGCGKTLALEAIAESENGVMIQMDYHSASPTGVLEKIARAMGWSIPTGGSRQLYEMIVEKLRGSGKLIIVDEIHALLDARDDKAFHTLRRLSDQTGCPQLWAATCDLMTELRKREARRQPLAQISSRIGVKVHLTAGLRGSGGGGNPKPLTSVEDILKIYGSNEMKITRDAGRFLARICTNPFMGLLRACTTIVGHAIAMNRLAGAKELTAPMLWDACQLIFEGPELESVWSLVKEEMPQSGMKMRKTG